MGFIDYLILLGETTFAIVVLGLAVGIAGNLIRRRWHVADVHCAECRLARATTVEPTIKGVPR